MRPSVRVTTRRREPPQFLLLNDDSYTEKQSKSLTSCLAKNQIYFIMNFECQVCQKIGRGVRVEIGARAIKCPQGVVCTLNLYVSKV
jgi:hypothetical protein